MSEFKDFRDSLISNFERLSKGKSRLYEVNVDRDRIYEEYLNGFSDPEERQGHTCNCCKSFLRQYGGIVVIENYEMVSIWDDLQVDELYAPSVENLRKYVHSLPISNAFLNEFPKLGTFSSIQRHEDGTTTTWNHLFLKLDKRFVRRTSTTVDSYKANFRSKKEVLKNSFDQLTPDAVDTVLELIAQNSLYRGNEFKGLVESFKKLQKTYLELSEEKKDGYCWEMSDTTHDSICRIKNTSIGTLLVNISEGMELDRAVSAFESVVAPTNYKRPAPIITQKMVEESRKLVESMGFMESLDRRFATPEDLETDNVLFIDKISNMKDIFNEMSKSTVASTPKNSSKVEEISISDFLNKVVPTCKSIEVLFENQHMNNLVSLITAVNPAAPSMFKWKNPFSWAYTNGVTDSIKEKVKAAGGNVEGELRVSLSWFNYDDLDLHVVEPHGEEIMFNHKTSNRSGGQLDIDMNAGAGLSRNAVENVIWTNKSKMLEGRYEIKIHNYCLRERVDTGFIVEVECQGQIYHYEFKDSPKDSSFYKSIYFDYSKVSGVTMVTDFKSELPTKEKWGIKTNQYHKVRLISLSPNYWSAPGIGNKHYMFFLEDCKNDENPRGIFNEFLIDDLLKQKRAFEVLGSKLKVADSDNQLSGLGFSDTKKTSFYVRVEGAFKRTLKVNVG